MDRPLVALLVGLALPVAIFGAILVASAGSAPELVVQRLVEPPADARALTLHELTTMPPALLVALRHALEQGHASLALDAGAQRALAALHLADGAAIALDGVALRLHVVHPESALARAQDFLARARDLLDA